MLLISLLAAAWAADLAIVHVTALPISGPPVADATVLVTGGKIEALGAGLPVPPGTATVVDGAGQFLLPGIIDVHSHMGVYSWPGSGGNDDGNEATAPTTPRVWAGDSFHVEDPALSRARAGGVTTIQVLPGSANLIGGQSAVLKLRPSRTLKGMIFEGAPRGIKMACGENPKRVYAADEDGPSTRMGNMAAMRAAFQGALDYRTERARTKDRPPMDLDQEVLLDVLDGEIRVHVHCYRADDIEGIYRVMDQYGVKVASFQHGLEAYKVRDLLAAHGTGVATWPDWWGFKMEAWDAVPENALLNKQAGVRVAMHSDSANTVQRLYTEAAKLVGTGMSEADALETITLDPATLLGVEGRVGTLSPGKDADMALFSRHPLDTTTLVSRTWIDGQLVYDRAVEGDPDGRP
jgi:imidazolonepropionase-like amidohydrolase